ncbi:ribosomal protein S18 acetylase RimI-like enzyme [Microvirga flocculans]|uniref:Ribosomal protein S18 acetylase RimI-like enzyme n=2 Tax=Microvirga flocculans TaxID=217168 RepID=A0A7W6IES1_9HYPH|nr:ribosomal protein S18 acetylase RimI-like enzyme [Microvirga flocculans]
MTIMAPLGYELAAGIPSVDDYVRLRVAAGLGGRTQEAAAAGLPNTWFGVLVAHQKEVVGMGRIIGDGGCFFQIVDMAVDPRHQGKGLGQCIMRALVEHLKAHAPDSAYISLIAVRRAQSLYERFGFRPTRGLGMSLDLS